MDTVFDRSVEEAYRKDGYVLLENLLEERELAALEEIVPALSRRLLEEPDENEHLFEKDGEGQILALRCIHNLLEQHPLFKELAKKKRLLELVSRFMSPRLFFYRGIMVIKQRGVGSAFPWHQDFAYWGKGRPELAGCWIALKNAGVENGCQEVIPGSHKWGMLKVAGRDPGKPLLSPEQEVGAIPVPVKAGSAIVFHSLLVHRSKPNRSAEDRWAIVYEYSAPELENGYHRFDRHCGWDPYTDKMLELK